MPNIRRLFYGIYCENKAQFRTIILRIFIAALIGILLYFHQQIYLQSRYWFFTTFNMMPLFSNAINSFESKEGLTERLIQVSETIKVAGINCTALFNGLSMNESKMLTASKNADRTINDESYENLTSNCERFQSSRGYIMSSLTKEEEDFPLAYSMIVYKDAEMVDRLLRAIYRPQNYYCIHVDIQASSAFLSAAKAIVSCFPNVFLASKSIHVRWGQFSVLEPEIICMRDLWNYPKWKYFINLTGQEFPLKTNFELVKIFTAYRGASNVDATHRWAMKHRWRKSWPPHGLLPAKGSVHITVNRHFVDFILHNLKGEEILNWSKSTNVPDETFFATLNANPQLGIKGNYAGEVDNPKAGGAFLARYKVWMYKKVQFGFCAGRRVRNLCIFNTGDLPYLTKTPHLFANKFFLNEDRTVIGCLEEKIFNDTRDEFFGTKTFNTTFYSNLEFVNNQVT